MTVADAVLESNYSLRARRKRMAVTVADAVLESNYSMVIYTATKG